MRKAEEFGIPKEQAILSATLVPARELGREAENGSITPGKLADFTFLDADPRAVAPEDINKVNIISVISMGRPVWGALKD